MKYYNKITLPTKLTSLSSSVTGQLHGWHYRPGEYSRRQQHQEEEVGVEVGQKGAPFRLTGADQRPSRQADVGKLLHVRSVRAADSVIARDEEGV